MPLWLWLIAAAVVAVNVAAVVFGARWQSVKPRACHTPNSPASTAPEEGTR